MAGINLSKKQSNSVKKEKKEKKSLFIRKKNMVVEENYEEQEDTLDKVSVKKTIKEKKVMLTPPINVFQKSSMDFKQDGSQSLLGIYNTFKSIGKIHYCDESLKKELELRQDLEESNLKNTQEKKKKVEVNIL